MIRYTALWLFVAGVIRYAWRDWCKALCILIVMLSALERPDMPKSMFGIQGLNPFNITLAGILAAVLFSQSSRREPWDVPPWLTRLFILYLGVMLISTARMLIDPSYLIIFQRDDLGVSSRKGLISEYLINTFKWLIPPILLVIGCRGRERQRWLVVCVLAMYAIIAYFVIRQMPLGYLADGNALQRRAGEVLQRRVGYHRVELATMFAGAAWAMLAARPMFEQRNIRLGLFGLAGITTLGLALTGGRTGYAAWCVIGLTLAVLKWRGYLFALPVAVVLVLTLAPGVAQRLLQGFQDSNGVNEQVVLAGRNVMWPYVLNAIKESPLLGSGRQTWVRSNLRLQVVLDTTQNFGHPHNAYLEFALDNGLVGLAVIIPLFACILWHAAKMFRARDNLVSAAGGVALAATLSYVFTAIGAGSFYPTEGSVGMWCLIALSIRVAREAGVATVTEAAPAAVGRPTWRRPVPGGRQTWTRSPRSPRPVVNRRFRATR